MVSLISDLHEVLAVESYRLPSDVLGDIDVNQGIALFHDPCNVILRCISLCQVSTCLSTDTSPLTYHPRVVGIQSVGHGIGMSHKLRARDSQKRQLSISRRYSRVMENDNKGSWFVAVRAKRAGEPERHSSDSSSNAYLARTWFLNDLEIAVR